MKRKINTSLQLIRMSHTYVLLLKIIYAPFVVYILTSFISFLSSFPPSLSLPPKPPSSSSLLSPPLSTQNILLLLSSPLSSLSPPYFISCCIYLSFNVSLIFCAIMTDTFSLSSILFSVVCV